MKRKINIKKNIWKRTRDCFNQYINGTKGAVSLLLALVMSPLLSIALLLVESARYQDAIQLMDEIIDISAFSALAEYDSYLDERFGLLAVSQDTNIHEIFEDYLNNNSTAIGSSVSINGASASGEFALSDTGVLKQQMLEYSEIMVASEVAIEGIDLEHLLEELEKSLDLEEFNKDIEALNLGVELSSTLEKLINEMIELKKHYDDKYIPALSAYESAYSSFENKASDLITALSNMEDSEGEDEGVNTAISNLENAADDYQKAASDLKSEYSTLKEKMETILSAVDSLPSKLQEFKRKASEPSLADKCTTSACEWLEIVADQITTTFNDTVGADFKDKASEEINELADQITKLSQFTANDMITNSWNIERVNEEYGTIILSVSSSLSENIEILILRLNEEAMVNDEEAIKMKDLLDIAEELLVGISGLYDANLDSIVDTSYLYNDTSMSLSSQLSVNSLTDLISAGKLFVSGITSANILEAVPVLGKLLESVANFLSAVIMWADQLIRTVALYILSGPTEWYNGLLLYGYGAYNTPNRTTYSSKKTLSGFSYDKVYELAGGINRKATLTSSLGQLSTIGNTAGSDKLFKGAETEYLLVGSTSELQNQSVTFFNLYLLRLVLDIIPIFKNSQVNTLAATAGPGALVVKIAIALAEPMLDTIILVNGGNEYLVKETVYLSYSGIINLEKDLVDITSISPNLQYKIKDTIVAHNGELEKKGKIESSYTEHMLILLMLSVNQTTYMQRMQNLIQLEGAAKNDGFQIDNAYTYIYSDVTYTLNPMLDIDSLTENGLFTKKSEQYCGY